jgi:hypothetical protein
VVLGGFDPAAACRVVGAEMRLKIRVMGLKPRFLCPSKLYFRI